MAVLSITPELEFYEVINAFPILKESLKRLNFNLLDVKEGESIRNFFKKENLSVEEGDILLKTLNREVRHFMKTGETIKREKIKILREYN